MEGQIRNRSSNGESKKLGCTAVRKRNGQYLFLISVTIIFIIFYSTPTNFKLRTFVKQKSLPVKSLWSQTVPHLTISAQLGTALKSNRVFPFSQSSAKATDNTSTSPPNSSSDFRGNFLFSDKNKSHIGPLFIKTSSNTASGTMISRDNISQTFVSIETTYRMESSLAKSALKATQKTTKNVIFSSQNRMKVPAIPMPKNAQVDFPSMSNATVRSGRNVSSDRLPMSLVSRDRTNILSFTGSHGSYVSTFKQEVWKESSKYVYPGRIKKYLVDSKSCRIPDFDPFHPSVRSFIEYRKPLDCSDYQPLTRSDGTALLLNKSIAHSKGYENFTCCYRALYRDKDGQTDDEYRFNGICNKMEEISYILDEFIRVECKADETTFYQNYHSFIQEKLEVEERCKDSTAKYSILLLGVDSMSRMNMHRQLNKTITYLKKNLDTVEMYGFNKVGDNTFPNLIPLTTGYNESELPKVCWKSTKEPLDNCDFIWKAFARKGYRTLYAEDTPYIASFNYVKAGFFHQPTDYYFRPFMLAYEGALGRRKKLNCYLCVGSVSETEAVLHWTKEFALRFKNKPYFSFSWINSLTHDFLNYGSSGDHMYVDFFKTLHSAGALESTIVILIGDHGMRWGSIRTTYIGRLEERLPMLVFLLPRSFKINHPKEAHNLVENSHRLVTPFDIHATLEHLMHIDEAWEHVDTRNVPSDLKTSFRERAQSLLKPVSSDRSCEEAHIRKHWCTCGTFLPADPNSSQVRSIAMYIIYQLNAILKQKKNVCARLKLSTIKLSRMMPPPEDRKGEHRLKNIYTVILQASPGDGVFEGTVKLNDDDDFELLGDISRLNLYKNQSDCVDDAVLKKYCYCK